MTDEIINPIYRTDPVDVLYATNNKLPSLILDDKDKVLTRDVVISLVPRENFYYNNIEDIFRYNQRPETNYNDVRIVRALEDGMTKRHNIDKEMNETSESQNTIRTIIHENNESTRYNTGQYEETERTRLEERGMTIRERIKAITEMDNVRNQERGQTRRKKIETKAIIDQIKIEKESLLDLTRLKYETRVRLLKLRNEREIKISDNEYQARLYEAEAYYNSITEIEKIKAEKEKQLSKDNLEERLQVIGSDFILKMKEAENHLRLELGQQQNHQYQLFIENQTRIYLAQLEESYELERLLIELEKGRIENERIKIKNQGRITRDLIEAFSQTLPKDRKNSRLRFGFIDGIFQIDYRSKD